MGIVLISTSNVRGGRSEALDRMLKSVENVVSGRPDMPIVLLLLLQNSPSEQNSIRDFPTFVDVSSIPHQISLSAARNILLLRAQSRGLIGPTTVVGFPDDDCWYPPETLEHIAGQFSRHPELDFWFCRYSSNPVATSEARVTGRPARARDVIRQASSNTMFVRGEIIQSGAAFDEQLGVGTPVGGAEDTEFALRAYFLSTQAMYLDAAVVGHRDKSTELRAKYYRGGLVAIATHARKKKRGVVVELIRKVAVGAWLTLRGELTLATYIDDLAAGANAWLSSNRGTHRTLRTSR
jgi:Glycosyl transferase family 2